MSDEQPPCTRGESHRFKMPPEKTDTPLEQEISRLRQQLAEAQQARDAAINERDALLVKAVATAKQLQEERDIARGLLRDEALPSLRIAKVNAKHNRISQSQPQEGCWTTCSACVIDKSLERITAALKEGE